MTNYFNKTRYDTYFSHAIAILSGSADKQTSATLLLDLRFDEIPTAFVDAIFIKSTDPMNDLDITFESLLKFVLFNGFGTSDRSQIPSWFYKNLEAFLAAVQHGLLLKFETTLPARSPTHAIRAFFDICAGAKACLSLDCLATSSLAHAVLVIGQHAPIPFYKLSATTCAFVNELSRQILDATQRDATNFETSFGYYAGSQVFRDLAKDCLVYASTYGDIHIEWIDKLEAAVAHSYKLLQVESDVALASLTQKRPLSVAFDGYITRKSSPTRVDADNLHLTPPAKCRAVSVPFANLVDKLFRLDA